jgi:catechol-2,3-dioxygenase
MTLCTADVGRLRAHYEDVLGLVVTHEGVAGEVFLSTGHEHHCLVLRPAESSYLERVTLALVPDIDLDVAVHHLSVKGTEFEVTHDPEPDVTVAIDCSDPEHNAIRLAGLSGERGPGPGAHGIIPEKLGHIAKRVRDVDAIAEWYQDTFGFKVADWIGDFFVFLRCGPEHHVLNFIRSEPFGHLHHVGYQLSDPAHLLTACDRLAQHGTRIIWGPGRHGAGHNMFAYYRDPDDHIVELFCQLDLMLNEQLGVYDPRPWHRDTPQRPKVWTDHLAGANLWGIGPPEEMHRVPEQHRQPPVGET